MKHAFVHLGEKSCKYTLLLFDKHMYIFGWVFYHQIVNIRCSIIFKIMHNITWVKHHNQFPGDSPVNVNFLHFVYPLFISGQEFIIDNQMNNVKKDELCFTEKAKNSTAQEVETSIVHAQHDWCSEPFHSQFSSI